MKYLAVQQTAATRRTDCLLYTSDAADDLIGVDLGGRRVIKKKTRVNVYSVMRCNKYR